MFNMPGALLLLPSPFVLVPQTVNNTIIVAILNQIFSKPLQDGEINFLNNNWLKIEVTDLGLYFYVGLESNRLVANIRSMPTDLIISANSCDFLSMIARKKDPDTLFFQRKIKMQGSTELGLYVKNFLDAFDVESSWVSSKIDKAMQISYPLLSRALCKNQ